MTEHEWKKQENADVDVKPLDFGRPQIQRRTWIMLPFVLLVLGFLEVLSLGCLSFLLMLTAGDDNGMTPADRAQQKFLISLYLTNTYLGLVVGLLLGGFVAVRFRRYPVSVLTCAAIGTALCLLPFILMKFPGLLPK